MLTTTAWVATAAKIELTREEIDIGDLRPHDLLIEVSHCGVCASDIDILDDRFGAGGFPLVAGHEIVGHVVQLGTEAARHDLGARVGVGPLRESCARCEYCSGGREIFCRSKTMTAAPNGRGGFAKHIRIDEQFAFAIPNSISSAEAAPLLCAGLTTFAPLSRHGSAGARVGVVGVGGLGHLAVQFARQMGMSVTTFGIDLDDAERARHLALGASLVVNARDPAALKAQTGSLDLILSTVHAEIPWLSYLNILRPEGRIVVLGASLQPLDVPAGFMISGARGFSGSGAGSPTETRRMLDFADRFGVRPMVETVPIAGINAAIARARAGAARYRMVVEL